MTNPRRSRRRWLIGAPAPVLAVYDNGGKSADRYTVLYGAPIWAPGEYQNGLLPARAMSSEPCSAQGVGLFVEAMRGPHLGKKIEWASLPEPCKRLVELDCL